MQTFQSVTGSLKFIRLCKEYKMNQRKIDEMIPTALQTLLKMPKEKNGIKPADYQISKVYVGYMASFGPAVIQSGIAKTLAFYSKAKGESEGDRKLLLSFIMLVLIKSYPQYEKYSSNDLLQLYEQETGRPNFTTNSRLALTDKILEAAIACKLAMNTYHSKEENTNAGGE